MSSDAVLLYERQDPFLHLGPAHDQVWEVDVVLVVAQRRAVDPGGEQPGGPGDGDVLVCTDQVCLAPIGTSGEWTAAVSRS